MSDPERPDPTEDNWLKLDSDACAISLDARLYDPTCPDDPDSKANTPCAPRSMSAPHGSRAWDRHHLCGPLPAWRLQSLRGHEEETHRAGVPREQVAIVHDYKKGKEFFGLQQAMRAGRVRVLLGTTEKCGIGVNIQTRLKALIDLDLPSGPISWSNVTDEYAVPATHSPKSSSIG